MQLPIDGTLRPFVPLRAFRVAHNLPDDFGLAALQPKTRPNLGSIDRAGDALNTVRDRVVAGVPTDVPATDLPQKVPMLAALFETELYRINDRVGLRDEEIAFAVGGFGDVCSAVAFALLRARLTRTAPPPFEQIYGEWLFSTVQVSSVPIGYTHGDAQWALHPVSHAYGRVGFVVQTPHGAHYVQDKTLACPAEGYMASLLRDVAQKLAEQAN